MAETYLTREGLQKLQDEFKAMQRQRIELLDEVNKAAAMGDLRENAEYHAARERLQHVSQRLSDLDAKLSQVRIIDDLQIKDGEARIGTKVTLRDLQTKEEFSYVLTGPEEADPQHGKLSIASPLGQALLGKKKDEEILLRLPRTAVPYRILNVERS